MEAIERINTLNDWITFVLLIGFLGLVAVKMSFSLQFGAFRSLLLSNHYFATFGKEISKSTQRFTICMWLLRNLLFSLGFLIALDHFHDKSLDFLTFLRLFVLLITLLGVKFFLEKVLAGILGLERLFSTYLFQKNAFLNYFSLFLFPILVYAVYGNYGVEFVIFAMIIAFILLNLIGLYSVFKIHQNTISKHFFYFILYLCALEIAPLVIFYKIVISPNNLIL